MVWRLNKAGVLTCCLLSALCFGLAFQLIKHSKLDKRRLSLRATLSFNNRGNINLRNCEGTVYGKRRCWDCISIYRYSTKPKPRFLQPIYFM